MLMSMLQSLRSAWIWCSVVGLILLWLPLLSIMYLFDRDPVHYRTGRWFRRLGIAMTKVNPAWKLKVSGERIENPRRPYVVVSNHQSLADIPLISHLPWEMKWVGKESLFKLPVVGWMMKLAGDIPVDRASARSGARVLLYATKILEQRCSIMFFPEGTRSLDARVGRFNDGSFHLAIRAQVPVLPLALDGSANCLPKKSWKFGPPQTIQLKVLPPVETAGMKPEDVQMLREKVRTMIVRQIAEWREVSEVDASVAIPATESMAGVPRR